MNNEKVASFNHMEKTDFLYFEVEDSNGINLIMLRERTVTISAKMRLKNWCFFDNKPF